MNPKNRTMAAANTNKPEAQVRRRDRRPMSERRRAILDAARAVFLEHGLANATIDAVVEQAGGSKTTLYGMFDNKEGLLAALVIEAAEDLVGAVNLVLLNGSEGPVEGTLHAFGKRYLEILLEPDRLALYRLVLGEAGCLPGLGDTFLRASHEVVWKGMVDFLRAASAKGQITVDDPERMAHFFIDALRGHVHMQVLLNETRRPTPKEIEKHVEYVVDGFLRAWH
jgi:AcrR family transcriptional regulator